MEKETVDGSLDDTRHAVKQAILLNEHLLRRAWGVVFVVLAFAMFFSIFGVAILDVARLAGVLGSVAVAMAATCFGLAVILWTFKRVRFAVEVTHPESDPAWSRLLSYRLLVPLWLALNGAETLAVIFAARLLPTVFFLEHLGVAAYLYYAIRLSFSSALPGEAVAAVGVLSLGSVASLALWPFDKSSGPYALIWVTTIAVWALCGIFALTRPVPEFEDERTGLE